jgi:hypothetical protein
MIKHLVITFAFLTALIVAAFTLNGCKPKQNPVASVDASTPTKTDTSGVKSGLFAHFVPENVPIKAYFKYMDSLARAYDTLVKYDLTAQIIVRANPWLIDTLANTDYYRQKERGVLVYDQKELVALKKGDTLWIPTDTMARQIIAKQAKIWLDVNIPEFKLRIIEDQDTLGTYPRPRRSKSDYKMGRF